MSKRRRDNEREARLAREARAKEAFMAIDTGRREELLREMATLGATEANLLDNEELERVADGDEDDLASNAWHWRGVESASAKLVELGIEPQEGFYELLAEAFHAAYDARVAGRRKS
jgi:hypothetical protein